MFREGIESPFAPCARFSLVYHVVNCFFVSSHRLAILETDSFLLRLRGTLSAQRFVRYTATIHWFSLSRVRCSAFPQNLQAQCLRVSVRTRASFWPTWLGRQPRPCAFAHKPLRPPSLPGSRAGKPSPPHQTVPTVLNHRTLHALSAPSAASREATNQHHAHNINTDGVTKSVPRCYKSFPELESASGLCGLLFSGPRCVVLLLSLPSRLRVISASFRISPRSPPLRQRQGLLSAAICAICGSLLRVPAPLRENFESVEQSLRPLFPSFPLW